MDKKVILDDHLFTFGENTTEVEYVGKPVFERVPDKVGLRLERIGIIETLARHIKTGGNVRDGVNIPNIQRLTEIDFILEG